MPKRKQPRRRAKGNSAFAVLMAAQAKRQRRVGSSSRSGTRRAKKDAFAEMMAAAKVGGAFEDPTERLADSSVLDRWRERPPACEDAYEVDRKVQEGCKLLKKAAEALELPPSDDGKARDDPDQLLFTVDPKDAVQPDMPQKEPTPGTLLSEIIVHIDLEGFYGALIGARLVYSDGVEVWKGRVGVEKPYPFNSISLAEGEYITSIAPRYATRREMRSSLDDSDSDDDDDDDDGYIDPNRLVGIVAETDKGRTIRAGHARPGLDNDNENKMEAESGKMVYDLEWDEETGRVTNIITADVIKKTVVPSLVTLARRVIDGDLAAKANRIEDKWERDRKQTRLSYNFRVGIFADKKELQLRDSIEAARVRYLREELARAENALIGRTHRMISAIKEESKERMPRKEYWDGVHDRRRGLHRRLHVDNEMLPYMHTLGRLGMLEEGSQLCATVACSAFFHWSKVPLRKRCSVEGCASLRPSCGCNVECCPLCKEPLCKMHLKSHPSSCHVATARAEASPFRSDSSWSD